MHCDTDVCCTTIKQYIYVYLLMHHGTMHSYDVTIRMFPFVTMQLHVC